MIVISPLSRHVKGSRYSLTRLKSPFFGPAHKAIYSLLYSQSNVPTPMPLFRTAQQIQLDKLATLIPEPSLKESQAVEVQQQSIRPKTRVQYKHNLINGYNSTTATVRDITPKEVNILNQDNIGLNLFLNRVYVTTGASIMMSLGTIYIASSIPYFVMNPLMCIGYGSAMTVAGMLSAYYIKPHVVVEQEEGHQHIKTRNGVLRSSLFVMGWMGMGLMSMPFANMLASFMPMIIPNLMAMTVGCFGGAGIMIAGMPRMPLFTYGGLIGGLIGSVCCIKMMQRFNTMIYGQHFLSSFIQALDMYGGTLVFMFFVYYNTVKAKQAYQSNNSDHLQISIRFYYDMLVYLKRLFKFLVRLRDRLKSKGSNTDQLA